MNPWRKKFLNIVASILGIRVSPTSPTPKPSKGQSQESENRFILYDSYNLKDGDLLVKDLEAVGMPFEVSLDDGIHQADVRYGSGGTMATLSLYIEKENFDIVTELVNLRFPH